jgi:S-disulfanyl-L-cysteine oxidoreductase SoxD
VKRGPIRALALVSALGGVGFAFGFVLSSPPAGRHFADADDLATVVRGQEIYRHQCASCHGRSLQGQPLWQLADAYAGRRAPAQDETGHTWRHADEDLFHMTKFGRFGTEAPAETSAMPGFKDVLSDDEILAVIAFIKSRWPIGLRVAQAMLNPGLAGMPARAAEVEWSLPPDCGRPAPRAMSIAARQR